MATSGCASTATRFVTRSSRKPHSKRTHAINHPLAFNSTKRIGAHFPLCTGCEVSPSRWIGRGITVDSLRARTFVAARTELPQSPSTRWLVYLRRQAKFCPEAPSQSRKKISTMIACALYFLASAASVATGTGSQSSAGPNPSTKCNSGGGPGPRKTTKPVFIFSKQKAEEDVRKVEADAREDPYLVSESIFQGARWTMEDTYKVENGGRFVAVFDGHGGAEVSSILQERLYDLYSEALAKKHWEEQNQFGAERKPIPSKSSHVAALQRGLEQVEDAIMKLDELSYQGSTAVCVVLHIALTGKRTLLTANIGDSRAILCRGGKAVDMTRDHKPGDEQEKKRIEAMGEEIEWDPYGQVYRVRDLSLSRAVGDRFAKPIVSSEPEIMTFPVVEEDDEFVLLASDGLWDVMSSQEVVDFVHEMLSADIYTHSQLDKRKNMARIVANEALERGSADNVCVVLLWLK